MNLKDSVQPFGIDERRGRALSHDSDRRARFR